MLGGVAIPEARRILGLGPRATKQREAWNRGGEKGAAIQQGKPSGRILNSSGAVRSEAPSGQRQSGRWRVAVYTFSAPFSRPARSLIPTPGPLGTVILPSFTRIGGSNQLPYFSVPSLYS
jgi:hypothetical protein